MKSIRFCAVLLAHLSLITASPAWAGIVDDNFNDNTKNPAKWGDDIFVDDGTNIFLIETNSRLELSGSSASGTNHSSIVRPWIGSFGSYTQSWEAAVDVNVGAVSLPEDNGHISMFLAVVESGDPEFSDHLSMELYSYRDSVSSVRRYSVDAAYNHHEVDLGQVTTADLQSRLRIAFDASTKILTASYNGTLLGSMDVDAAETSWAMTSGSQFQLLLGGSMRGSFTYNGHEVYADNFELRTGNDMTHLLTICDGTGSGFYTNGASVVITASNAPTGWMFDRWIGSTQYITSVTSSPATVTMPAQAITLTATYKLTGAGSYDDFNDNNKDPSKWGSDMLVGSGTNAVLTEIRGHLEFTGSSDGEEDNTILRPWIGDAGSYTQNWEVAVDLRAGLLEMPPWSGLQMFMAVATEGNIGNRVVLGLSASQDENEMLKRKYEWSSAVNDTELTVPPNAGEVSTGDLGGRVQVAFDASTKTLYGSYNGIPIGWIDVDAAGTSWGMSTGSTFMVVLGGSIWDAFTNNSSEVYADNFELRSGSNLTYALTVLYYGSGSGFYTNNAKVPITASNAPPGWEFDRWVGSTQYIASVTSTTSTVTMPAHAVALVPSYKLSGTPSGDDFSDNSKDSGKWADDIQSGSQGVLDETSQRLEFQVSSSENREWNTVSRPWRESVGSYTQSWEIAVDAHLGTIPAGTDYLFANMNLTVFNRDDTNWVDGLPADQLSISLDENQDDNNDGDGRERGYEVTSRSDGANLGFPGAAWLATADRDGRLKISFDASRKVLRASCNGRVLGWLAASNWDMSNNDTFGFALTGSIGNNSNAIPSGEMFFDNFETVGAVAPPEFTYTISGGGVTITCYIGSGGAVTVPETIEGFPVVSIADDAFGGCLSMTSLVIPASVTNIGSYAFSGCVNTKAFRFEGNAPALGAAVFSGLTDALVYCEAGTSGWGTIFGDLSVKTLYPVAAGGMAMGAAFDGTNYLIGVENPATLEIGAQMLSPAGTKTNAWITTGRTGIAPAIAFDGTNYLMVWEDDGLGTLNGTTGFQVYGQRISRAGVTNGSPFAISSVGIWVDGMNIMAYGGGIYLVTYTKLINPALGDQSPTNRYIAGRRVLPNGTVSSEFRISDSYGAAGEVAFDGSNFLVVWREDQDDCEIRGRLVTPSGSLLGTELSIDFDGEPSDNPITVIFDGTNYVVGWSDEVADGNWDLFARKVSKTGTMVGDVVTICDDPGMQMLTGMAFDGELYLAVWSDMQNPDDWDMYGSYVYALSGLPGDGKFPLMNAGGNQLGGVKFLNGKYLVAVNDGAIMADGEENRGLDGIDACYVMFIRPDDTDGDGLPDAWEVQYFGNLTKTDNPAAICANGINTVMDAYVAGLNPTNPSSFFVTSLVCPPSSARIIQWNAVTGRVYNVYWTTNLLNSFQPLYTNYTGGAVTDTVHSTEGKCFYKLDVRLP